MTLPSDSRCSIHSAAPNEFGDQSPERSPRAYRRSPRIPMPTAAPGYVTEVAEPTSAPTPALFARADVAGNATRSLPALLPSGPCTERCAEVEQLPRQRPPGAECRRGRRHLDAPAGRSYSGTAIRMKQTWLGDANAAPRHGQRRAARERAGMPGDTTRARHRRTLRRNSGSHNRRRLCDVLLSCPHPRCLWPGKSGSGCRHTFRAAGNPTGWNRTVLFPRRCPRRGAHW